MLSCGVHREGKGQYYDAVWRRIFFSVYCGPGRWPCLREEPFLSGVLLILLFQLALSAVLPKHAFSGCSSPACLAHLLCLPTFPICFASSCPPPVQFAFPAFRPSGRFLGRCRLGWMVAKQALVWQNTCGKIWCCFSFPANILFSPINLLSCTAQGCKLINTAACQHITCHHLKDVQVNHFCSGS